MNRYFKNIDILIFGISKFGLYLTIKLFVSKFIFKKNIFKLNLNRYFKNCVFYIRNSEDSTVFIEHFLTDYYNVRLEDKVHDFVLVDCGAFNGVESLRLFANLKSNVNNFTLISIEPNKKNFEYTKLNLGSIERNILYNNAVYTENDILLNEKKPKDLNQSFFYSKSENNNGYQIKSINLDHIIKENRLEKIDILKIDIEGGEELLFSKNTSWLKKVNCLILEVYHVSELKTLAKIFEALNTLNDFNLYTHKENLVIIKKNSNLFFEISRGISN